MTIAYKKKNKKIYQKKIKLLKVQKTEYTCENGYTLNGNKCSKTETISATASYSCNERANETLKNNKCYTNNILPAANATCPNGATYNVVDDICAKTTSDEESICTSAGGFYYDGTCTYEYSIISYTCEEEREGYELIDGNNCVEVREPKVAYSCPAGYTLNGSSCTKTITMDAQKN